MQSSGSRALVSIGLVACIAAMFIKSVMAGQSSWFVGLATLILIVIVLVEAERNRHIGRRGQSYVLAAAMGVVVSEPILWLLDWVDATAVGVEFTATSDPITLIAGAAAVAYSWRYRRKRGEGHTADEFPDRGPWQA